MFLSREMNMNMKNCVKFIRKFIYMQFCIKVVGLNRSYSENTKPIKKRLYPTETCESQVCSYASFQFPFQWPFKGTGDEFSKEPLPKELWARFTTIIFRSLFDYRYK